LDWAENLFVFSLERWCDGGKYRMGKRHTWRLKNRERKRERLQEKEKEKKTEKLGGGMRNWKHWFAKERFKHPS
jgi:hypothetical protein